MPTLKSITIGASGYADISNLDAGQPVVGVASADFTVAYWSAVAGAFSAAVTVKSPYFSLVPYADLCRVTAAAGTKIEFRAARDVVAGGATGGLLGVTGTAGFSSITVSTAELTRPSDTNAYLTNDAISNSTTTPSLLAFANVLPVSGADGYIVAVRAFTNKKDWTAPIRVHLYKNNTPTPIADNVAFGLLYANAAHRVGFFDVNTWKSGDATASDAASGFGEFPGSGSSLPIELAGTGLWAQIQVLAGVTPASGQKFWFSIKTQLA